jgi:hypothetical protein
VAETDGQVSEIGAGVVGDGAVLLEDREAAASAVEIALIGGDEAVVVDPLDGVGLAKDARPGAGEADDLVLLGVDLVEIDGAGREIAGHGR